MQTHMQFTTPANLTQIIREVRIEGFCVVYCNSFVLGIVTDEELVSRIWQLAASVGLKVSFNPDKTLCIFEQY